MTTNIFNLGTIDLSLTGMDQALAAFTNGLDLAYIATTTANPAPSGGGASLQPAITSGTAGAAAGATSGASAPSDFAFANPVPVAIVGYSGAAMEPEISPDGNYLFFNNSNAPGVDTNIYYATRINDTAFQYQGQVQGVNTPNLDAIPSMGTDNQFYFISNRSYATTLSTIYSGTFNQGTVTNVGLVPGNLSLGIPGWFNMDATISRDGQDLYFTDNMGTDFSNPSTVSVLNIAANGSGGFTRLSNSDQILQNINDGSEIYGATVSADQLELFYTRFDRSVGTPAIYEATRASTSDPFGVPAMVSAATGFVEAPSLSYDDKLLYYCNQVSPTAAQIYVVSRDDTTPPAVTIVLAHDTGSSATDGITSDDTLTGSGDSNTLVTLTEGGVVIGQTTSDVAGTWTFVPVLSQGSHTIVASETDLAGNTGTTGLTFTYDSVAPTVQGPISYTGKLAALEASGGSLAAKTPVATFAAFGGLPNDSYSFTLSGKNAGSFSIASSAGVGTLSTGASTVGGSSGGRLYALNVQATDATSGVAAAAIPLDIIVGASNRDTINAATLTKNLGISVATASFIYGQGANDTLNASGMTGNLWFVGGPGADTITGGSGVNSYLYGTVQESSPSSTDVITNFHVNVDRIDLTGIGGTALNFQAAQLVGTSIPADAIAWQQSGANTFIYVNTTAGVLSLKNANMKIELNGGVALTASDVLHN